MSDVEPEEIVENVAEAPAVDEPAAAEPEAAPAESKRGRGRPAGSKDVKPRKRKVTIVEEPLAKAPAKEPEAPEAPEVPKVVAAPSVEVPEPPVAPEPPAEDSPRTLQHKAAELLIRLRRSKYDARRTTLAETYAKGMMRM